jgi:hypothetical protein
VSVKNASDTKNRDAIRSHLPHIVMMFAGGDFQAPGIRMMAARKATIRYEYVETPRGGRVDIVTADSGSLAAIHDLLRFQIADHHTGGSTAVRKR